MDGKRGDALSARPPTRQDLARIAHALNENGARYAVIGGFAMLHHGFARATMDIDLLIDPAPTNSISCAKRCACWKIVLPWM